MRIAVLLVLFALCFAPAARAAWPGSGMAYTGAAGPPSACPDNDGSSGATAGTAQYPSLLAGYAATINGAHGLGCLVAGVDYRVGLIAAPSLSNPTLGGLPAGASYSSGTHTVMIASNNVTFTGWDMSVSGGLQLKVNSGVTGTIITGNKFLIQSPNCLVPMFFVSLAGTTTVQYNQIDGGGAACQTLAGTFTADVYIVNAVSGAAFTFQWNDQENVSSDGLNVPGAASGTPLAFIYRYNLMHQVGWIGNPLDPNHPDGIQFDGGLVASPIISHSTFFNSVFAGGTAGVQPYHVEAQLNGTITNAVVSYNTLATTGTCNGGVSYPTGCSANFPIACKQDSGGGETDVNTGFSAFGNYIDWSGAIAALSTEAGCTGATWGTPLNNYDMISGTTLTHTP